MANQKKLSYVAELSEKLLTTPDLLIVEFNGTKHKSLEDFRTKLREGEAKTPFVVLKNSLFRIAFDQSNKKKNIVSQEESEKLQAMVKGQLALMLLEGDWLSTLKVVKAFAKEDESLTFKAGVIEGLVYEESGLRKLADLPGKSELAIKIILALRASHTKLAYSLQFNTSRLVTVLKRASEGKTEQN